MRSWCIWLCRRYSVLLLLLLLILFSYLPQHTGPALLLAGSDSVITYRNIYVLCSDTNITKRLLQYLRQRRGWGGILL